MWGPHHLCLRMHSLVSLNWGGSCMNPPLSLYIYSETSHKPSCFISGTIMTISKDRVKPSPLPDSWKLAEIFATGVILGSYLAMMTVIFFWAAYKTDFFPVSTFYTCIQRNIFLNGNNGCRLAGVPRSNTVPFPQTM